MLGAVPDQLWSVGLLMGLDHGLVVGFAQLDPEEAFPSLGDFTPLWKAPFHRVLTCI